MSDALQSLFEALFDMLCAWAWPRRIFFGGLLTALFALGWWHWPTAGVISFIWGYLEIVARMDDAWFRSKISAK